MQLILKDEYEINYIHNQIEVGFYTYSVNLCSQHVLTRLSNGMTLIYGPYA